MWRVQKVGGSTAQYIKEGEPVRLCWRFSDQKCGFRDFYNDIYGRRWSTKPEDVDDNLYLRAPFPGFQRADTFVPVKVQVRDTAHTGVIPDGISNMAPSSTPTASSDKPTAGATASSTTKEHNGAAMVMSPSSSRKPFLTTLNVIGDKEGYLKDSITYSLFDVTFRIDVIGNPASDGIMDYLTQGLDQRTSIIVTTETGFRSTTWSVVNAQQTGDTFAELGKRAVGLLVFGPAYNHIK